MTMTVLELMKALSKYDVNMPVYTEGCDCDGEAGSVYVIKNYDWDNTGSVDALMISRSSEAARIAADEAKKQREKEMEEEAAAQRARGLIA